MLPTLFHIPAFISGVPLFGWGVLALAWAAWSAFHLGTLAFRHGWTPELRSALVTCVVVQLVLIYVTPQLLDRDPATGRPLGIAIRGYGVMLLLGIVSGVGLTLYRARRRGVEDDVVLSLALWVFVAGMIGARAFYVVEYWDHFRRDDLRETIVSVLNLTQGGLVVFGGLLGAVAALAAFCALHRLPPLAVADLVAPGMTLGLALGRVGCFFNGCCFGDLCALPWAVEFPPQSPPYVRQIEQGRAFGFLLIGVPDETHGGLLAPLVASVEAGSPAERAGLQPNERFQAIEGRAVTTLDEARAALSAAVAAGRSPIEAVTDRGRRTLERLPQFALHSRAVHPTQIYSAIDALLTTLLLLSFGPLSRRDGETFALLLTVHPVSRFLLEIIRIDEPAMFGTGLSISQNISVVLLACGAALWLYVERRRPGFAWPQVSTS